MENNLKDQPITQNMFWQNIKIQHYLVVIYAIEVMEQIKDLKTTKNLFTKELDVKFVLKNLAILAYSKDTNIVFMEFCLKTVINVTNAQCFLPLKHFWMPTLPQNILKRINDAYLKKVL